MEDFSEDVRLASKGDTEAFARLYSTVYKDMYHIARYSLRNAEDASDAVSDAVLDAFCSIKKLRQPELFRSWIMKILSAKIKQKQREYFADTEELSDDVKISSFDFGTTELKEALEKLDSESRLILSMSVLGGYSSGEIADVCRINAGTVRSKLSRIKEKLRLELS
jgi:RNA polymerase sigma-70 factor (ECF subfamily)